MVSTHVGMSRSYQRVLESRNRIAEQHPEIMGMRNKALASVTNMPCFLHCGPHSCFLCLPSLVMSGAGFSFHSGPLAGPYSVMTLLHDWCVRNPLACDEYSGVRCVTESLIASRCVCFHFARSKSLKERAEGDDAWAIYNSGCYYYDGGMGWPQDKEKSIKLWLQAGELGCAEAYYNLAHSYFSGEGAEKDLKKAKYYFELAAMGGCLDARFNLGILENNAGNMNRAMKHWMISAGAGYDKSLERIREYYLKGHATKEDFEKALRAHKEAKDETKSDQREAAAAAGYC